MRSVFRVAAVVAACVVVAGCANDGPRPFQEGQPVGSAVPSLSAPPTVTVTVQAIDNSFRPDRVEITPGTEVVWVNRGRNDHDVLSDFDFGVAAAEFRPGDEYRYVFTEPGEYPYYCTIHGTPEIGMVGTIVVTDAA